MEEIYLITVINKYSKDKLVTICHGNEEHSNFLVNIDKSKFELLDTKYLGIVKYENYKKFLKTEKDLITG